ncbi:hypothetical protein GCM10023172_05980 [Hymenobacter ginsengisoli]|uniref:Lipoprotein n=1 Tax=Hymenobacter ginsengisoli TaxID=1051626 RepID=A0ABP8Q0F7_9BACT|nr:MULTISPECIES: hypothetical protein [unclassified Hymenobacter]MBO2033920.1 hypothetical protein [Hymenobacter sp. BT559]
MKKLLLYLAPAAMLLVASCSSEPSDWRPENKVSDDMIPPGTRPTDNFDQGTPEAPSQDKGGAISRPLNSGTRLEPRPAPSANAVMSGDTQEGTALAPGQGVSSAKKNASDSPTPDTAQGQAGARRK